MENKSNTGKDPIRNILDRKSVRKYTAQPVEKEKIEQIIRAGMAAPSGKNTRPWEIVIVDERAKLDAMAEGLPYAKMLRGAQCALVVCGDQDKSGYWYLDCAAATQNMLLAVEALGLGAVWTAAYPYEERMEVVERVLGLPGNIKSLCVIPVGYPDGNHRPADKFDESKIHTNRW